MTYLYPPPAGASIPSCPCRGAAAHPRTTVIASGATHPNPHPNGGDCTKAPIEALCGAEKTAGGAL